MNNKGLQNIPYEGSDGAVGYITDVTQEHFYNEPDIGLYDELEQSCYELVCDFAQLIGVHLDKSEQDCRLANLVRDFVGVTLEKEFSIPFPSYGESEQELADRLKKAKEAFERFENGVEPSKAVNLSEPSPVFRDNDECALALFNHLVSIGEAKPSNYDIYAQILHDINNLRGHEWLQDLDRNLKTKPFFDYIGGAEFFEDEFIYGKAVAPDVFMKCVFGEDYPENISFEDVRNTLDKNGFQDLWDFPVDEIDEALESLSDNSWLLGVSFYEDGGYFARIFEITQDMADRFESFLVVTERGDYVLPCDVMPNDSIVGPYKKPVDLADLIKQATSHLKCNKATNKDAASKDRVEIGIE